MEDPVPYGFELSTDGKTLVEDLYEQEWIALIKKHRALGCSWSLIREVLQEEGIRAQEMVPTIRTAGRTDCADYFEQSGLRSYTDLAHTPILVFLPDCAWIEVRLVTHPQDLLALDDAVCCMGQWRGEYRSDFFQFTVGQLRAHLAQHPKEKGQRI